MNKENAKLTEKLDKIREETPRADRPEGTVDPKTKAEEAKKVPQLTPEEQKRLAEIQKELAKLGTDEKKNAELADTLNKELKKNNDDMAKSDLFAPSPSSSRWPRRRTCSRRAVSDAAQGPREGHHR